MKNKLITNLKNDKRTTFYSFGKYNIWRIYGTLSYFYYLCDKLGYTVQTSNIGTLIAKPSKYSKYELEFLDNDILYSEKLNTKRSTKCE